MANQPAFIAYNVRKRGNKDFWTRYGAVFAHKQGGGLTVILEGIPAPTDGTYEIVLLPPKERPEELNPAEE